MYNFGDRFKASQKNRHNSFDSRHYGLVPEENITGKAIYILFSFKNREIDKERFRK